MLSSLYSLVATKFYSNIKKSTGRTIELSNFVKCIRDYQKEEKKCNSSLDNISTPGGGGWYSHFFLHT